MLPSLQVLTAGGLYAWVPGETKHNLKIIIPAWLSMMIIIPVGRADRTEKKLSEERRSSCWNCLKRGWDALGEYTSHTITVLSGYWIRHLTRIYKDFSIFGPSGQEYWDVYSEIWLFHNWCTNDTSDILDFGCPGGETLGKKYVWRTRGRWGQDLPIPPQFWGYGFNATQQCKLRTRGGQ